MVFCLSVYKTQKFPTLIRGRGCACSTSSVPATFGWDCSHILPDRKIVFILCMTELFYLILRTRRRKQRANKKSKVQGTKRTYFLPSTCEEAEVSTVTASGNEQQTFDSLHPMIHGALNDCSIVVWQDKKILHSTTSRINFKELRHDILSHFFNGINCGYSAGKPKNNVLLRKKNLKGVILKRKGARMAEDGEDWIGLAMTILKSLANFFKIHEW